MAENNMDLLAWLRKQLEVAEPDLLREMVKSFAEALMGAEADVPGVASVLAATLLAEIGEDRERFPGAAALLAEAGLAPVTRQSGKMRRVRFRRAASHRLRQAFTWWAFNSLTESPWARQIYDGNRDRGQRQYRALRGLAACWGRVLYRCWQEGVPYEAARHPGARALLEA